MENKKDKASNKKNDTESAIERGKQAVKADEKINKAGQDKNQVKKEREKDAEQWRNEG
jgi:hypothetical protein